MCLLSPEDRVAHCMKSWVTLFCMYSPLCHCQNRFHGVLWTPLYLDFSSTVEVHTVDKTKTYHYNASYGEHTGLNTASWQITLILILLKTSAASWKVLPLWHLQQVTPLPLLRNTFKQPTPITFPEVKVFHL